MSVQLIAWFLIFSCFYFFKVLKMLIQRNVFVSVYLKILIKFELI